MVLEEVGAASRVAHHTAAGTLARKEGLFSCVWGGWRTGVVRLQRRGAGTRLPAQRTACRTHQRVRASSPLSSCGCLPLLLLRGACKPRARASLSACCATCWCYCLKCMRARRWRCRTQNNATLDVLAGARHRILEASSSELGALLLAAAAAALLYTTT